MELFVSCFTSRMTASVVLQLVDYPGQAACLYACLQQGVQLSSVSLLPHGRLTVL